MRKVDAFLSRQAQESWPTAIIWKEELKPEGESGPTERFVLEREGVESIILGYSFKETRAGLVVLMSSERSRKKPVERKENEHGNV